MLPVGDKSLLTIDAVIVTIFDGSGADPLGSLPAPGSLIPMAPTARPIPSLAPRLALLFRTKVQDVGRNNVGVH